MHSRIVEMCRQTRNGRSLSDAQPLHRLGNILIIQLPDSSTRGPKAQAQHLRRRSDKVTPLQMQLVPTNLGALDRLQGLLHNRLHGNKALQPQSPNPLHHLLGHRLAFRARRHDALDRPVPLLPQLHERHLGALHPRILDPSSHRDRLAHMLLANILQMRLVGSHPDLVCGLPIVVFCEILGRSSRLGCLCRFALSCLAGLLSFFGCFRCGLFGAFFGRLAVGCGGRSCARSCRAGGVGGDFAGWFCHSWSRLKALLDWLEEGLGVVWFSAFME